MKTYRRHYCERQHRTDLAYARCIWSRAAWITGDGPYAVTARCRALTVTLWPTLQEATEAKRQIDYSACGGMCRGAHEIIHLERPE